jgi:hypothetical protein
VTTTGASAKVVTGELHRVRRGRKKAFAPALPSGQERKPAQVAVMLALAHKIRQTIDRGEIRDQAKAARRLGLTRARLTQILDLTLLAPVLQEKVLFLEAIGGAEPPSERLLRDVVQIPAWRDQESLICAGHADSSPPHVFGIPRGPGTSLS